MPPPEHEPSTLVDVVEQRATSDDTWLLVPNDPLRSDAATQYSFAEICERARSVAAGLRARDSSCGSPVGLIFDNDVDFCTAFLGTVLAGKVPVPLHPPYFSSSAETYRERVFHVLDECDAESVLVAHDFRPVLGTLDGTRFEALTLGDLPEGEFAPPSRAAPGDTAYIQYSSGSTRMPLGAEVSHSALLANLHGIGHAIGAAPGHRGLCWLPLFHDMGLAGTLLCSFYWGASLVLMTPKDFIVRPASWLWAMSRFRCRTSAAPNFAYALCASRTKVPDHVLDGLELDGWDVALTGAESVRSETIDAFVERLSSYGFRKRAVMPVYGLAENVVASCFAPFGVEPRVESVDRDALEHGQVVLTSKVDPDRTRRITSVGRPLEGQQVRVVDGADEPVAERVVGSIQIAGACVMKGYRKRPVESRNAFTRDGWLRTGDLGYIASGDLFIVGREKDIIKKNGAKYDAADIQSVVSTVHGARAGGAAVFSVDDPEHGTEAIVAVVETRLSRTDELATLKDAMMREVRRVFGTSLDRVVLVPAGSLAKSTSGKVRNAACRDEYLQGAVREIELHGLHG